MASAERCDFRSSSKRNLNNVSRMYTSPKREKERERELQDSHGSEKNMPENEKTNLLLSRDTPAAQRWILSFLDS